MPLGLMDTPEFNEWLAKTDDLYELHLMTVGLNDVIDEASLVELGFVFEKLQHLIRRRPYETLKGNRDHHQNYMTLPVARGLHHQRIGVNRPSITPNR